MDNNGWIKIHRKLLEWEWYSDPNMVRLWIHLLLKANFEDRKWMGMTIPRGSFKTNLTELIMETGLSKQKLRTCLERLKSTQEITQRSTHKFTIITICKFDDYQLTNNASNTPSNMPATHEQHTSNTPIKEERKKITTSLIEKEKDKKEKDEWDVLFDEWLEYKRQKKQSYKGDASVSKMKNRLRNMSGGDIGIARIIIDTAIANNWAGFYPLKDTGRQQQQQGYKGDATLGSDFQRKL